MLEEQCLIRDLDPKFSNHKPCIIYEDKVFEIANLHIHKKI